MSESLLKETLHINEAMLNQQFTKKLSVPLANWIDPDRYPDLGNFDLEDPFQFLPNLYKSLVSCMGTDINWRSVISKVIKHNEIADMKLEKWIRAAKLPVNRHKDAFRSIPFIPDMINDKFGLPLRGTLWSLYVIPLLLTRKKVENIAIDDIYHRKLDYTEFYSQKYNNMLPSLSPPPAIIVNSEDLKNVDRKLFTLIEGLFRISRAQEIGETYFPCKVISWQELEPYIHLQPIKARYCYEYI